MDLRNVIKVIRARKWLIISCAVIVTAAALVVSFLQLPTYRGKATVLVAEQNVGTTLLGSPQLQTSSQDRDVQTQIQVMQSLPITEQVIRTLGLETTSAELLKRVAVSVDVGTSIVTIDVTDRFAERAANTANAFAEGYVAWSQEHQRASIKAAADDVQQRLVAAQRDLVAIEATAKAKGATIETQVRLQAARDLYSSLADKLQQLRINQQLETGYGSILASAAADPTRVSPNPPRDGAVALVVGLMLGVGAAFLAEALDNTIKSADEAEEIYGAPVLASIPAHRFERKDAPRLALVQDPGGPAAEAYRVLRNNLDFINFEHDIKTVLVTSSVPSEGKSTVAANLAIVLSQAGKNVVLVVSDFHRPASAQFFDVDHSIGLSDVLVGAQTIGAALQRPPGLERLSVLTAGKLPPNPSELLGSTAMGKLIASLGESVDWIIVDSAPLLAVADAAAAARWVDGVLVATRVGVSTRDAARKGREQLEKVGARILGVAVWGLKKSADAPGYYGYTGYASR